MRIQQREDGVSFDQIVLSPVTYWTEAPGAPRNDTTILPASGTTTTTTTTTSHPPPNGEVVLYARHATTMAGAWSVVADATAAGGARMANPNAGKAKVSTAAASPASYFELSFAAEAGRPYRLWMRGQAAGDSYQNDSAFVQFSGSVDGAGRPQYRIGTTDATWVGVEQGASQGLHGWGWSDNGYDCMGPVIYFDGTPQTIRIQVREDGLSIDQIVLSPAAYLATAPGAAKNDTTILAETAGASDGGSSDGGSTGSGTTSGSGSSGNPDNQTAALRILQWNTHHGGFGTDGKYDTNRLASWIVKMAPDVVMLNEIEKFTSWGNQNQPEVYKALLEQKTGKTGYYLFAQEYGNWTANGKGNLILSTVPFTYTNRYELVHNGDRSVAEATITWNGRPITLLLTHLDPDSQTLRLTQATEVTTYAAVEPENRVLTGDMNAWPDQTSIAKFDTAYVDSWVAATALGKAVAFAGNTGQTKNGRIDYIFLSKGSTALSVVSSQVYDTRDANGIMPSDHRPVLTTFAVR
jgi:endonuclease/exonuclease/phosphatase family metal-dependent hydrolase